MEIPVEVTINGRSYAGEVEPRQLLVHFIRENAGLTGTKVGCDTSQCGTCTVELDGVAAKACTVLTAQASGSSVMTIEGLSDGVDLHPLQEAFWNNHGLQCGFCTPGMILAANELLRTNPSPTREADTPRVGGEHLPVYGLPEYRAGRRRRRRRYGREVDHDYTNIRLRYPPP